MTYNPDDLNAPDIDTDEPIEQAYGRNGNLTPGKKAKGGTSVRLSAYLMPEQATMLARMQERTTAPALSKLIGQAVAEMLREQGYRLVRCPNCGAEHVEAELVGGMDDDWMCPDCRHLGHFSEWRKV